MKYFDFHTHRRQQREGVTAIVCVGTDASFDGLPNVSVGLHPWQVGTNWAAEVEAVRRLATRSEVRMIGECGLDRLRPNFDLQQAAFEAQLRLARALRLPVVVHCVRAVDELLRLRRGFEDVPMVFHGFRGKPQQAAQLLRSGIGLSFGPQFNVESLRVAFGQGQFCLETDDTDVPIEEVYERASSALSISPTDLPVPGTTCFGAI